jgi:chromosome segregation ATPase
LEKAERASLALHEKQSKADVLLKKVEGLKKQNEKQKILADRKLSRENEVLHAELTKLKTQYEDICSEKKSEIDQLVADRVKFKHKAMELMKELERVRIESSGNESKLKEEVKELTKRCQYVTEKMNNQKQEFHTTIHNLNSNYDKQKADLDAQVSSFTGQKKAYLERIGELESDLEILERSMNK